MRRRQVSASDKTRHVEELCASRNEQVPLTADAAAGTAARSIKAMSSSICATSPLSTANAAFASFSADCCASESDIGRSTHNPT